MFEFLDGYKTLCRKELYEYEQLRIAMENNKELKHFDYDYLSLYDERIEEKINNILRDELCKMMLKWEITAEYVNGFKKALSTRTTLLKWLLTKK